MSNELDVFTVEYMEPIKFEFHGKEYSLYMLVGDNLMYKTQPAYGDIGYDLKTVFYYNTSGWTPCKSDKDVDLIKYNELLQVVGKVYHNSINYKSSKQILEDIKNAKKDEEVNVLDKINAFNKLINI